MTGRALTDPDSAQDSYEVVALLSSVGRDARLPDRVDKLSRAFLGRPYAVNPLGGGPGLEETLTVSLQAFDCVTYIETVLALALSREPDEFVNVLKNIRYEDGEVAWHKRNHYMSGWARNNASVGFVRDVTTGPFAEKVTRRLSVVEGLPARQVSFHLYRKRKLVSVADRIEAGDLILFASAKRDLDFFHTGLLVGKDGEMMLRHATRSEGSVIEEPLTDFLGRYRMSGFALLRPVDHNESKQD